MNKNTEMKPKEKNPEKAQMQFKTFRLSELNPASYNPRTISDDALKGLQNSLSRFGCVEPIIVNVRDGRNTIVGGHQRHKALKKLHGKNYQCSCVCVDLDEEDEKLLNLSLNNPEIQGEFISKIDAYIDELRAGLTNQQDYLDLMIDKLRGEIEIINEGLTDADSIPEPPDEATTKTGDLWILQNHRLYCGDSGKAEDVDRLLDGARIHLVNTDPPYGVQVAPRSQNARAVAEATGTYLGQQGMDAAIARKSAQSPWLPHCRSKTAHKTTDKMRAKDRPLANDFLSDEEFAKLLLGWFGNIQRVLELGRSFYIWGGYSNIWNYPNALRTCQLYFSQMVIWVKEHPVLTRKDFMGNHEWCFYGWKEGAAHKFFGPANITDVWSVKKVAPQNMIHLTEKPVELAVRAIQYSSQKGENVLDLFGGSGSTLIAAEQTGRNAFLMECDCLYCDIIKTRFSNFVGPSAKIRLIRNGKEIPSELAEAKA